jgi:ferredoxin
MGDDGIAEVYQENVPKEAEGKAIEAQEGCPVSVITVEE